MGKIGLEQGMGKNWFGELLEGVVPGEAQFNTVIGDKLPFMYPETWLPTGAMGDAKDFIIGDGIFGGMDYDDAKTAALRGLKNVGSNVLGRQDMEFGPGWEKEYLGNLAKQQAEKTGLAKIWDQIKGGASSLLGDTTRGDQTFNWKIPVAGGLAAGAYTASQPRDVLPMDETGINFQTAEQAMADPNLRFKPEAQYANVAEGGRIGYQMGDVVKTAASEDAPFNQQRVLKDDLDQSGGVASIFGGPSELAEAEWKSERLDKAYKRGEMQLALAKKLRKENPDWSTKKVWAEIHKLINRETEPLLYAQGGRIGYADGTEKEDSIFDKTKRFLGWGMAEDARQKLLEKRDKAKPELEKLRKELGLAQGGRIRAQEGGLMDLGGMEKDYRQEGGFVPIGGQEKADDVPARLSKNEFVFTAAAVRSAGGGDIDAGAEVMENLMEHLEAGGKVSEDSQGLEGAQEMFANTQRLQNRII